MSVQRTLASTAALSGVGLHSGKPCSVVCRPAPPNHGLAFVRTDLPDSPTVSAHPDHLTQRMRRTALAIGAVEIHTAEHMLAAAAGLGIDNMRIEIDAEELPGMDGSSRDFVAAFRTAGIVDQQAARREFTVTEPISVSNGEASIIALPYRKGLRISYTLDDHGGTFGGAQIVEFAIDEESFDAQIAGARTFCMKHEVEALRAMGLGKGATCDNTLVFDGAHLIGNQLRYPDEAARHKLLDIIGDLSLSTRRINAHIIAVRSGHRENMQLVQEINRRVEIAERPRIALDIREILEYLPHRYPILLVDRIIEFEANRRIVGIKNVTINEPHFAGHFPDYPVMPGVLMVEAMGQTGAVLLLASPENRGKIPNFMSLDKVKFRRPVFPGDQMRIEVEVLRVRTRMAACRARVLVEGHICAEAECRSVFMDV